MLKYLILIIMPLFGFILVRYGMLDRQLLDLTLFILLFLLFFYSKQIWFLTFLIILFTIWQINDLNDYYWFLNFTIVCIALLKSNKNILDSEVISKYSLYLVIYIFIKTLFDLIISDFVEGGDRIAGPFTSSLHLAYFCVIYSFIVSIIKPPFKQIQILLLLTAAGISGSRVGAAGVFLILIFQLTLNIKILVAFVSILYIFYFGIPEIRVLSYIPEAEDIRFGGFLRYFEGIILADPVGALFGFGRKNYGAVGYRFFGDDVFITESSFIMLLYSYGLILGTFLFLYITSSILKIGKRFDQKISAFVIILFIILSPFIDSPAIFFVNMIFLGSVVRPLKEKNSKY